MPRIRKVEFPKEIPTELSQLVGEIVIAFGQLERILIIAHARICHGQDILKGLKINKKKSDPLGPLIRQLQKDFKLYHFEWFNPKNLREFARKRNGLMHDALIKSDGHLEWLANSTKREHRPVDCQELIELRDDVCGVINQIEEGSEKAKNQISKV